MTTSIESSSATFDYNFICGEKTVSDYMNGVLPLKIISLHPNPAGDEVTLSVVVAPTFSRSGGAASQGEPTESRLHYFTITDALGKQVFSDERNLPSGTNEIHLDTKKLSGGVYLIRINSANGSVSQSFIKIR